MGIRSFDYWLVERGLLKEAPLSSLSGTRIGIDANNYIRRLLSGRDPSTNDTFVAAVGGAPLTLTAQIEKDLKILEDSRIKPVFVFSGIALQERERPLLGEDPRSWRRAAAWDHYEQGRVAQAQAEFANSNSVLPQDIIRIVHRLFKQRMVEFVVAPYLAWAQLVYLERHERAYVHSIYGSSEIFMFDGMDNVILNIDFTNSIISHASKSAIIADLGVTSEMFLDIAILAGFENSPPFPGIDPRDASFRSVVELVKARGTGTNVIVAFRDYPPVFTSNYMDQFARSRCAIRFSLVLVAQEGRVLPLPLVLPPPTANNSFSVITAADVPADLGDIFSPHFPDEVYYLLFRGLINPQIITVLATGHFIETTPLCGSTPEYERYLKSLGDTPQSPKCVSIALVSSVLHPSWSKKPVSGIYYFDPGRDHVVPHGSPQTVAFIDTVSKWNVDVQVVENELRRQLSSTIDLSLCLGGTSTASLAQRTVVSKNPNKVLYKKDEVVANTLWRFLELRLFLTPSHQHTLYAQALYLAMKSSKVNDKFQEALYLAMELLRAGQLHNGKIGTRIASGGPNFQGTEEDKRSMLLVMRVLSIVPLSFHPGPWTGPLSRELLNYNSFIRATSRSMRNLLESIALNILLRSDARRSRDDYVDIVLSLPFQSDTNTGMGILFKAFGDTVCSLAGGVEVVMRAGTGTSGASEADIEAVSSAKQQTLDILIENFPNVKNVEAELQRGIRFWQTIMVAVRGLKHYSNGAAIKPDLLNQFDAADAWLKPFAL